MEPSDMEDYKLNCFTGSKLLPTLKNGLGGIRCRLGDADFSIGPFTDNAKRMGHASVDIIFGSRTLGIYWRWQMCSCFVNENKHGIILLLLIILRTLANLETRLILMTLINVVYSRAVGLYIPWVREQPGCVRNCLAVTALQRYESLVIENI